MTDNVTELNVINIFDRKPDDHQLGNCSERSIQDLKEAYELARDGGLEGFALVVYRKDGFVKRTCNIVENGNIYKLLGATEMLKQFVLKLTEEQPEEV
jgi:hypothetical protein